MGRKRRRKHVLYTLDSLPDCVYCGREGQCRDHVVPLSAADELDAGLPTKRLYHILTADSNVVPCCVPCNQLKGSTMPAEWFGLHPEYIERFKKNARFLSNLVKDACGIYDEEEE